MGDFEKIKEKVEDLGGWLERWSKSEDYRQIIFSLSLRIPAEHFDEFVDWLASEFKIERSNFELYRIVVKREMDEIAILLDAQDVYTRLLERVEKLEPSDWQIDAVMKLTNKKLEIMRKLREYGYTVEEAKEKERYSTLSLQLIQEKPIRLVPENLSRKLRMKIRDLVSELSEIGMNLITVPIALFFKVVLWIVYAIVILIPIFVVGRFLWKVYQKIQKKL